MKEDVIVAEVRRVREKLIKQYGGFEGYMDHIQEMDAIRLKKMEAREVKKETIAKKPKPKTTRSKKRKP